MSSQQQNSGQQGLSLSSKAKRTREQPISYLISAVMGKPDMISFAAGLVDEESLPVEEVREITRRIFSDTVSARAALQYDTTLGLRPLREALIKHFEELEGRPASTMNLTASDILVT